MRRTLLITATSSLLLFACTPASNDQSPSASESASASARASAAPSGTAGTSASPGNKQIALQVVVPEEDARAGVEGNGWTVDVIAKGDGPAMDRIRPAFRMTTNSGKNGAFPGLVVVVKPVGASSTTNASGSPVPSAPPNLAGLFQIVGLPNTLGGAAGISSVSTSATSSPAATGSETAEATWFVLQSLWGTNVDVELTALVVDGDAPDTVADVGQLKAVSNIVTVSFHINGSGVAPSSTVRPTPSGSTASSVPSGSARPSASSTP